MSLLILHVALVGLWVLLLPYLLREIVSRRSLAELLEVARSHLEPSVTRTKLENRRAFICEDQRHAQNPANTGFAFFYDCRQSELTVRGKVPPAQFWSLSLHDRYSRPIGEFLVDESVESQDGEYEIRLSTNAARGGNQLDVSSLPRGVAMLRISHLADPSRLKEYLPSLHASSRAGLASHPRVAP